VTLTEKFIPSEAGPQKLLASLDCRQLPPVHGVANIDVKAVWGTSVALNLIWKISIRDNLSQPCLKTCLSLENAFLLQCLKASHYTWKKTAAFLTV